MFGGFSFVFSELRLWFGMFLGNVGAVRPKLQRYPLRSGAKSKEEKPPVAELSNHSASKRYLVFLVFVFLYATVYVV